MKFKEINRLLLLSTLIFLSILILTEGCANIQNPTGGPKDTVAPKLIKASPENGQIEFKSKKITLTFSKLVKLVNPQKEIVVTPEMSIPPTFMDKKNTIIVAVNDEKLKPNTTYIINFGKAISDLTEGNLAEPYKYVFSTGKQIDSLSISGNVIYNIDTAQIKDVFVGIYAVEASDILKDTPLWFTYTDEKGQFHFINLKAGKYKIYAFTSKDQSRRFNYKKLLGFLPYDINLSDNLSGIKLILSKQLPDNIKIEDKEFKTPKICLMLNAFIDPKELEYTTKSDNPKQKVDLILATELASDTICFYPSTIKFNTLEIKAGNKELNYDTITINNFNPEAKPSNVDITTNLNGSVLTASKLNIYFSFPIEGIENKNIILTEDGNKVDDFELKKVEEKNPMDYELLYSWNKNAKYSITIPIQSVKSIYGGENTEFKREFTIANTQNAFGSLKLKLTIPTNEQYIVRLIGAGRAIEAEKIASNSTEIEFTNILPGKYRVIFIHDINKNSKWDLASFTKNRQAEPVTVYPDSIEIRANWEVNRKYDLKKDSEQKLESPKGISKDNKAVNEKENIITQNDDLPNTKN